METIKYKIKEEIAWRKMKDGTVTIVSPVIDKIITINETAGIVWSSLDRGSSSEEISSLLYSMYQADGSVTLDSVKKDVQEIINVFIEKSLIE